MPRRESADIPCTDFGGPGDVQRIIAVHLDDGIRNMEKGAGASGNQDGGNAGFLYKSPARSRNGVIGSFSRRTTFCIKESLTMKLVAEVSSSNRKTLLPASIPSMIPAAWEVLPLASSVEKHRVSLWFGRSLIKREISTSLIKRPSSERSFRAVSSVMTYSRPSPGIWLYTPSSRAFKRVDFP